MSARDLFLFLFFLVIIPVTLRAQDNTRTTGLTLQQCIEIALKNNPDVKTNEFQSQTAAVNLRQARSNLLPNLSAAVNHSINQGRSIDPFTNTYSNQNLRSADYSAASSVTLFSGLLLQHAIKQNSLALEASKMELQQQKDNLALNVILAYLQVLTNEDLLTQANNQAEASRLQVKRLEILNKDGAIPPSQLSDLKGQLASDEVAIISAKNALDASKIALAKYMNTGDDQNLAVQRLNAEDLSLQNTGDPDSIYQTALNELALIKAAGFRTKSAGKAVQAARAQYYPTLSLNGNLYSNYSSAAYRNELMGSVEAESGNYVLLGGNQLPVYTTQNNYRSIPINYYSQLKNNFSSSLSVGLSIPLFGRFQNRNRVALAKIDYQETEFIERTTKIQLKQAVDQAYINKESAVERYGKLQEQVDAYAESFKAAEVRFNAGVGTSDDYTIAKNKLDQARINLISTRYDYIFRNQILDYYQGKLSW